MEKPQGGIFFLPKKEDWEKFSMALTLCTFKRFPCYKRWKAVRRFSWKRGTLEVSGRWWFITKTPLDSLTHAVMTLADAYNLPTECQSLVPLQPKIDPCHALPPPPLFPLFGFFSAHHRRSSTETVSFVAALGPFQDPWTVRKISFARSFFPQRSSSFLPRESRRTSHFECKVKIWDTFH